MFTILISTLFLPLLLIYLGSNLKFMEKLQKYSTKDFFLTHFSVKSERQKGSSGHFCHLKVSVVSNAVSAHELS